MATWLTARRRPEGPSTLPSTLRLHTLQVAGSGQGAASKDDTHHFQSEALKRLLACRLSLQWRPGGTRRGWGWRVQDPGSLPGKELLERAAGLQQTSHEKQCHPTCCATGVLKFV